MSTLVANRYGSALYELACDLNCQNQWEEQVNLVLDCLKENPLLIPFFKSVQISSEEKKALINQCFADSVDQYILNFLCLLIDKHHINDVDEIGHYFLHLYNQDHDILEGTVVSTHLLEADQVEKLAQALSKVKGKQVKLGNKVDTTLIGGLKVYFENEVIDGSYKAKLNNLRKELLSNRKAD